MAPWPELAGDRPVVRRLPRPRRDWDTTPGLGHRELTVSEPLADEPAGLEPAVDPAATEQGTRSRPGFWSVAGEVIQNAVDLLSHLHSHG
jgi:hypothetical protein